MESISIEDESDNADYRGLHIETPEQCGRVDKVLSAAFPDLSRSRIQALIEQGQLRINGIACDSSSRKLVLNDTVEIAIPPPVAAHPQPENISLDIIYEDDDLLVINKQAGLVVHPGAGNYTGTLVNALLYHCRDSLSGIGGVLRPGIVHRLDKDTSGLMVVAKNDSAHHGLALQLEDRSLSRIYQALVFKTPFPPKGHVDAPIGRHATHRLKMTIARSGGKEAKTYYHVTKDFRGALALLECKLETGRTHQIRVHMESLGHPLIGDALYGPQPNALRAAMEKSRFSEKTQTSVLSFPRQALHAKAIQFIHPATDEPMAFAVPLPKDISNLLKILEEKIP